MLRFKQIQANIPNPPSDSKTKDDMMDEFYISPEVKNRTLAQRKARISNVTATKKMTTTSVQKPKEFDENQLFPDFDEKSEFPKTFTAMDKKKLNDLYKAQAFSK